MRNAACLDAQRCLQMKQLMGHPAKARLHRPPEKRGLPLFIQAGITGFTGITGFKPSQ